MIDPQEFTGFLNDEGYSFFTGVPDSLLKDLCSCISDSLPGKSHIIAANEGGAVGLAVGYHLATGNAAAVYLQNSGIGNTINPLLSLADPDVYGIPMLMIVGWRGEPGVKDEPQHKKQGRIQDNLLSALGYRYEVLSAGPEEARKQLASLTTYMRRHSTPVVLVVRKDTFSPYPFSPTPSGYPMTREGALNLILQHSSLDDRIVSTTGKTSREIYELRQAAGEGHGRDFLTVGSMGHALMIALGLARHSSRRVICIDGDGAALMHLGGMAITAGYPTTNLVHILINNGAHESVGGQPTLGFSVPFPELARQLGYARVHQATTESELAAILNEIPAAAGPVFLEVRVAVGARSDLGRPTSTPQENKRSFMEGL